MRKYPVIEIMLILSILTVSMAAASPAEQYHKPKITEGTSSGASINWAGYALDGPAGSITNAKGSWKVPAVTCSSKNTYSSFWVGIDGDNSNTVEQTGTSSDCSHGNPRYYAWYEFYPSPPVNLAITVSPGNIISAEVNYNGNDRFAISITNTNTSESYSTSATVSGAKRSSAEWIAEAPWFATVLPLANFGTAYFGYDYTNIASTGYATANGVTGNIGSFSSDSQINVNKITMTNRGGRLKAATSSLSTDGTSFSVKWYNS